LQFSVHAVNTEPVLPVPEKFNAPVTEFDLNPESRNIPNGVFLAV
jgi:hypothetical protein